SSISTSAARALTWADPRGASTSMRASLILAARQAAASKRAGAVSGRVRTTRMTSDIAVPLLSLFGADRSTEQTQNSLFDRVIHVSGDPASDDHALMPHKRRQVGVRQHVPRDTAQN